jgi:hypothetical protein
MSLPPHTSLSLNPEKKKEAKSSSIAKRQESLKSVFLFDT